jgi:hypothetical protein
VVFQESDGPAKYALGFVLVSNLLLRETAPVEKYDRRLNSRRSNYEKSYSLEDQDYLSDAGARSGEDG